MVNLHPQTLNSKHLNNDILLSDKWRVLQKKILKNENTCIFSQINGIINATKPLHYNYGSS